MCDYSLHNVKTRPAQVGDKVTTRLFKSGTRGFCAPEDKSVAVCLLPGTELSFTEDVRRVRSWPWTTNAINYKTAIFRQINKDNPAIHHDHPISGWTDCSLDIPGRGSNGHGSPVAGGSC